MLLSNIVVKSEKQDVIYYSHSYYQNICTIHIYVVIQFCENLWSF